MILGIDVGLTGAIAVLDDKLTLIDVVDMPTMPNGLGSTKVKQMVNGAALAQQLRSFAFWQEAEKRVQAYAEVVSAMPEQGVAGVFSFGQSLGTVLGVLAALEIPVTLVRPQAWKKHFGLLKADKDASRTLAIQRYPTADLHLKKHHNRADAILIGLYGARGRA